MLLYPIEKYIQYLLLSLDVVKSNWAHNLLASRDLLGYEIVKTTTIYKHLQYDYLMKFFQYFLKINK